MAIHNVDEDGRSSHQNFAAGLALISAVKLLNGLGLAFMSAIACTVMIIGNSMAMKRADSIVVIFYMVLSATVILGAVHLFLGLFIWPDNSSGWVGFLGVEVSHTIGITLFFAAIPMIALLARRC